MCRHTHTTSVGTAVSAVSPCQLRISIFDENLRAALQSMCRQHTNDARWGAHATQLVDGTMFCFPGNGGHDDQAHPPIHPTRYTAGESAWSPQKMRLYEFIVRHFLA